MTELYIVLYEGSDVLQRERIICCKDCEYYLDRDHLKLLPLCGRVMGAQFSVDPYGYCAWRKKKGAL